MKDENQAETKTDNKIEALENNNNSKIISKIINLRLKIFFKYLSSLFKQRDCISKVQFFNYLKSIDSNEKDKPLDQKEINKILISEIIYHRITNNTKNIYYIYKNVQFRKKIKYFEFWRRYAMLCTSLENELNSKNSYDKKINDLNKKIKDMSKKRDGLKTDEKKIIKSLQNKEEQKNNIQKNVKNLTNKCRQLQKEKESYIINNNIMNVKNATNRNNVNITTNSTKNRECEEKKMELESNLRQVKEEDLNNDKKFKDFINNIDSKLNDYQAKANDILRQRNQKSMEINKIDYEMNIEHHNNI